jgi:uncharacterized protein
VATETDVPSDALFAAIRAADASTVQELLDAEPNLLAARDAQGLSPLMVALYHNASAIADWLLGRLPQDSLTIHEAAATGNVARLEQLLAQDPQAVNAWSPDGFQPLGLAAFFGRTGASELLLQRGGDVNTPARHPFGVTALHAALASPNPEFARALIAAGADVNATQSGGETPLHEAAFNGYLDLARLLLEHGANPAATDSKGRTPFELAREREQTAVAELLEGR